MIRVIKKVLVFPIVLLSAAVLWPLWPSRLDRELSLYVSIRLLLILAAVYGAIAFADLIRDRRDKGML